MRMALKFNFVTLIMIRTTLHCNLHKRPDFSNQRTNHCWLPCQSHACIMSDNFWTKSNDFHFFLKCWYRSETMFLLILAGLWLSLIIIFSFFPERHGPKIRRLRFNSWAFGDGRVSSHVWDQPRYHKVEILKSITYQPRYHKVDKHLTFDILLLSTFPVIV